MTDRVIDVQGLTRTYGDKKKFTAVDNVSLHVTRGEVYGLLGTNGAGKTSTLEVIEGLAPGSAGQVRVLGADPAKDRDRVRPYLGIMLQSGGLPQSLTVDETMDMWAGTCSAPRPIDDVLREVQLDHRRGVRVASLSGGEQRRLDLACALLGDPEVLFLDEPTTGLDPESRRRVWQLLEGMKARGVTMVLTTHYMEEAEVLCDRIGIMHAGRIQMEGTTAELVGTVPAQITFALPAGTAAPQVPGTQVHTDKGRITIDTPQLQHDTLQVLRWAEQQGIALDGFAARPATLERVFHELVDRSSAPQAPTQPENPTAENQEVTA